VKSAGNRQRFLPIGRVADHVEAGRVQESPDQRPKARVIVDHDDGLSHSPIVAPLPDRTKRVSTYSGGWACPDVATGRDQ
jgi:hypothetical protein